MVEAARDLARHIPHAPPGPRPPHKGGPVDQDVRALQQRITEETIGSKVLLFQLRLLVLVSGHALEPAQRRDHGQQQVQFGMCRHLRLQEDGRALGIEAGSQPVDHHLLQMLLQQAGVVVIGGQGMPVGHEEIAFEAILQRDPVAQGTVVVAEVQLACGGAFRKVRAQACRWRETNSSPALYGPDQPLALPQHHRRRHRQVDHRGGLDAAMAAVDHRIQHMIQPLPDLLAIGQWLRVAWQQQREVMMGSSAPP